MKLMMAEEFESTGAFAMFAFQRLSAGNGTNPFKLPPCPVAIPLHAFDVLFAGVTVTLTAPDVAPPGSGLTTVTGMAPVEDIVPDAVSWLGDVNVVAMAFPPKKTCAPLTKLLPVRLKVKGPL